LRCPFSVPDVATRRDAACGARRRGRLADVRTFASRKSEERDYIRKNPPVPSRANPSHGRPPQAWPCPRPGWGLARWRTGWRLHLGPAVRPGPGPDPDRRIGMLKGKVAIVTGSTSGIGLGIATAFAQQGADIVLNGFGDAVEIEKLRAGLASQHGVKVLYDGADL